MVGGHGWGPYWNIHPNTRCTSERLSPRLKDRPGPSCVGSNAAVVEDAAGAHANVPLWPMALFATGSPMISYENWVRSV